MLLLDLSPRYHAVEITMHPETIDAEAFHRRYHPSRFARRAIECAVRIEAPAGVVWEHLVGFDRYASWNPFLIQAQAELRVGTPVDLEVALLRRHPFHQREWINLVQPDEALCWGTHMGHPALLTTNRWQTIRRLENDASEYRNRLELSGVLSPLVMFMYGDRLDRSFKLAGQALKTLCEA